MKKIKMPALYSLAFLLSVLPVLIYFFINHDAYISTQKEAIKLLFGGSLAIAIVVFKTLGFLKIKSSILVFLSIFVFSYLLESVISDLLVFSFLALVGELLSMVVRIFISKEKRKMEETKTEQTIEKAILKSNGRV